MERPNDSLLKFMMCQWELVLEKNPSAIWMVPPEFQALYADTAVEHHWLNLGHIHPINRTPELCWKALKHPAEKAWIAISTIENPTSEMIEFALKGFHKSWDAGELMGEKDDLYELYFKSHDFYFNKWKYPQNGTQTAAKWKKEHEECQARKEQDA